MKKAILVVSFGTTYPETRKKTIEACEKRIVDAYPDYDVYRAFTSNMVIGRIKKQEGMSINTTSQALKMLKEQEYQEVIVQPLHVITGSEYHKVLKQAEPFRGEFTKFKISRPLLTYHRDYEKVIESLDDLISPLSAKEAIVLMAHGSEHASFATYACLDHMLGDKPVEICCVESYPHLDDTITSLKAAGKTTLHLYPFMLVAGDHATNDMASDDDDSWKSQLIRAGFNVETHLVGLGENKKIQAIYLSHLSELMNEEEQE
ncbi:sirohydrochlorin cobaltochelatase [Vagococcus fessus]|uniref:Sirohydrochlorin cobaltochelatase n=1 Tax=Vagococcus fessus TaxID=120370 RepID=A0A430AD01_9ENTE|nr:sirohydrochlorin cobaltochelatase [Vagococcus fessus]RSU05096.1 sirohydrochlorin cobaltochelatase [Vagococcus fessus]